MVLQGVALIDTLLVARKVTIDVSLSALIPTPAVNSSASSPVEGLFPESLVPFGERNDDVGWDLSDTVGRTLVFFSLSSTRFPPIADYLWPINQEHIIAGVLTGVNARISSTFVCLLKTPQRLPTCKVGAIRNSRILGMREHEGPAGFDPISDPAFWLALRHMENPNGDGVGALRVLLRHCLRMKKARPRNDQCYKEHQEQPKRYSLIETQVKEVLRSCQHREKFPVTKAILYVMKAQSISSTTGSPISADCKLDPGLWNTDGAGPWHKKSIPCCASSKFILMIDKWERASGAS
ncbi:hypothetical protein FB446DRAFT_768649 [Lentinula raphanica]|nr:hypothetical protein FB446DRAFT_768649 [Lentinula raphanica]